LLRNTYNLATIVAATSLNVNKVRMPSKALLLFIILILNFVTMAYYYHHSHFIFAAGQRGAEEYKQADNFLPTINDPNLKVEEISKGLKFPTSMAFLGPKDILVLEKNNGTVQRIVNGKILAHPLLDVPVATKGERGMLGIAVAKNNSSTQRAATYVFLYYTQSGGGKTGDDATAGIQPLGNRLYRYELINNNKLLNPKLLLKLPTSPKTPNHNGGKIVIGPDQNVYLVVGDVDKFYNQYFDHLPLATKAQNIQNGKDPDGAGGILRLTQDGKPALQKGNSTIFDSNNKYPLNLYYAYGIRNSFGLAFDPITGMLWDTENGPDYGDEINLVQPGFNSGWGKVHGMWYNNGSSEGPAIQNVLDLNNNNILVNLEGKGKYRPPEFTWRQDVAPTGLAFLNSTKLGKQYENDMFGDYINGNLYHFKLNSSRTGLVLNGTLSNKISNTIKDNQPLIFASGFAGGITDVKVSPYDGNMYILTAAGFIYRISSSSSFSS
jgi:glucose/arabinose dehydrogenase